MIDESKLVLVDVGAAGGIDAAWLPHVGSLHCVLVEPAPEVASDLREKIRSLPSAEVIEAALYDKTDTMTLNVTRFSLCSSLREPDTDVLDRYTVAPCFDVVRKLQVRCVRYDSLPSAPPPDMLKIDVQGAEYEVLQGFGRHLNTVLGIELEAHLYPIYRGQKLLGDLVAMLAHYGLRLRRLVSQDNFDQDLLEVNAYFTREGDLNPIRESKRALIHQTLGVHFHGGGTYLAQLFPRNA